MVTQTIPPKAQALVPMRTIRNMARQIANRYHPEQIILFGSYAYGKPTPFSDVDLLVVMDAPNGELETGLEIVKSLHPIPFSVDVVVRSRAVLEKRKQLGDWFLNDITAKGKVLYERTDR
jgi:predicted nucleotidyltransferase